MSGCSSSPGSSIDIYLDDNRHNICFELKDNNENLDWEYCPKIISLDIMSGYFHIYKDVSNTIPIVVGVSCSPTVFKDEDIKKVVSKSNIPIKVLSVVNVYNPSEAKFISANSGAGLGLKCSLEISKEPRTPAGINVGVFAKLNIIRDVSIRVGIGAGSKTVIATGVFPSDINNHIPLRVDSVVDSYELVNLSDINGQSLQDLYDKNLADIYYKPKV